MENLISYFKRRNPNFLSSSRISPFSPLLQNLVFSHTDCLIQASPDLPSHEVTSDLVLLVELGNGVLEGEDVADIYVHSCHLMHGVSCRVSLEINSSFWSVMLDFLGKMVEQCLGKVDANKILLGNAVRMKAKMEVIQILRAPSVFSVLLLLLHDSSNFKIRIHAAAAAAAALAVPASMYVDINHLACAWPCVVH